MHITGLYAGLLAGLFLWLSWRVVLGRRLHRVSVGDGDEKDLIKRMRAQSNWVEYTPIGLILLGLVEMNGVEHWIVHLGGLSLALGRFMHAYGFGSTPQIIPMRKWGMFFTLWAIIGLAALNVVCAITSGELF